WADIVKILNVGYSRDFAVLRCERGDNDNFGVQAYRCFGPKLLATRDRFPDPALESRCLTYQPDVLTDLDPKIPLVLPAAAHQQAERLRNALVLWRFRHWATTQADPYGRVPGVELRVQQILQPLLACVDDDMSLRETLVAHARRLGQQLRDERRESV